MHKLPRTSHFRLPQVLLIAVVSLTLGLLASAPAWGISRTYTLDADFDEGSMLNVNHDTPNNDQLQLDTLTTPFPFICIALSGRGTIIRADVNTGQILGEYWTSPSGMGKDPSRTTVDLLGNVWVANRAEDGVSGGMPKGSITRVALVIGGTRCNSDGTPNPAGQYLAPPFDYSTAVDRDGDGLIKTSTGLGNVLAWTNAGGADTHGGVSTAEDECIINYTRVRGTGTRTVAVDANNDVWVGGRWNYWHEKVDGVTGLPVAGTEFNVGCGGYGGLIDGNNVLWSASIDLSRLLRYDIATATETCIPITYSYGLGIDNNGYIWNSTWSNNRVAKIAPDGTIQPGFPKATGGINCRGVCVTPADNNVWIANSGSASVTRMDNNGTIRKIIPVGNTPTGLAVDANGKVWVTNYGSHNAMRIDPAGGGDGLGAVDYTLALGAGASPYNYSDMTGIVAIGSTAPSGRWTVVYDGMTPGMLWGTVLWNSMEPAGTGVTVEVRAADAIASLPAETFVPVTNGVPFAGIMGRYIEIRAVLSHDPGVEESPILYDLTVFSAVEEVFVDIKPGSCPNPLNVRGIDGTDEWITIPSDNPVANDDLDLKADNGMNHSRSVIPVAILGSDELDVFEIDWTTVTLEGVPALRRAYEDVSTPVGEEAEECECNTLDGDGYMDMTLKFDKAAVIAALGSVADRDMVPLTLEGALNDGSLIEGTDCMWILMGGASPTAVVDPTSPVVGDCYPNPFNPTTSFTINFPLETDYTVTIYNLAGRVVNRLQGHTLPGVVNVTWNGTNPSGVRVASGVYFYRVRAGDFVETRKMLMLK